MGLQAAKSFHGAWRSSCSSFPLPCGLRDGLWLLHHPEQFPFALGQPSPCPSPSARHTAIMGILGNSEDRDPSHPSTSHRSRISSVRRVSLHLTLQCPLLPPLPSKPWTDLELGASWNMTVERATRNQRPNPAKHTDGQTEASRGNVISPSSHSWPLYYPLGDQQIFVTVRT